jgi:hypothetical protein
VAACNGGKPTSTRYVTTWTEIENMPVPVKKKMQNSDQNA